MEKKIPAIEEGQPATAGLVLESHSGYGPVLYRP